MKKFLSILTDRMFSMTAAGFYIILFAIAIGGATFVENDFGTSAAQKVIYRARWFEILLILFSISLMVNIWKHRLIQNKKWSILTFHLSFLIILLGAAITRYHGYEGMMHIREGSASNVFLSSETYLNMDFTYEDKRYRISEPVHFASLGNNHWSGKYKIGPHMLEARVDDFIPNPGQIMETSEDGLPTVKLVMGGMKGREEYYLRSGDRQNFQGLNFNFSENFIPGAIQISYTDRGLFVRADKDLTQMQMATRKLDTLGRDSVYPLLIRTLYTYGPYNFVVGEFNPSAVIKMVSTSNKMTSESLGAVKLTLSSDLGAQTQLIYGQAGVSGRPRNFSFENFDVDASYGSREVQLPFSVELKDFQMEKYPGTNSASSYASEVSVHDPSNGKNFDYRIFMNNILNYRGFRFFQSSFDQDEQGTYLSVNHDFWGTWISYLGYFLLTVGMILALFSKKSRFYQLRQRLKSKMALGTLVFLSALSSTQIQAQTTVSKVHADAFADVVVQDHKGRLKPMHTLASEVLRKVSRKTSINGYNPVQVYLGLMLYPGEWMRTPLIKLGNHEEIKSILGKEGPLLAYVDFFDENGQYRLQEYVRQAHSTQNVDRGVFEKELIKIDERLNIVNMVVNHELAKIYPMTDHQNNLWISPGEARRIPEERGRLETYFAEFWPIYTKVIDDALAKNDWSLSNELIHAFKDKQRIVGAEVMPSPTKINTEILLNNMQIFSRLGKVYGILGLLLLVVFFLKVFKPLKAVDIAFKVLFGLTFLAFLFHTAGLGMRWYVSGRAPWSNGYESMIYIGFTTTLAGLIFSRKSAGGLAATSVLASTILMVAALSYLDPEITPLVPVLKSYWLTIHVSLEAGSYGFLMLGAIIGVVNLILFILRTRTNRDRVNSYIEELSIISELTLTVGLIMISIGTYLGGVWANESWGRYWGWDAKETWALVTILVYAFILHMRFIPGLRGRYAYNVASLIGFASVVMTYFGVNYYLSGLHSYAAGDPIPIPGWVYYTSAILTLISLVAYGQKWRMEKSGR